MARPLRAAEGGLIDHAWNRADARLPLFPTDGDHAAFERALAEAVARFDMRPLAYCVMPNLFHLVVRKLKGTFVAEAEGDIRSGS